MALLLDFTARAQHPAPVIDRVAAVVEDQVLTLSELDFEARVQLIQLGGLNAATGPLDDDTLRSALELSIAHRVEALEADKLQAFVPEAREISIAVSEFEQKFTSTAAYQSFLAAHDADPAQLAAVLSRGMRAERLLNSRIQLRAQVQEWEVRRYYDTHPQVPARPFEAVREGLKNQLMRERYGQLAKQELAQLAKTFRIRRVAPFARPPNPAEAR